MRTSSSPCRRHISEAHTCTSFHLRVHVSPLPLSLTDIYIIIFWPIEKKCAQNIISIYIHTFWTETKEKKSLNLKNMENGIIPPHLLYKNKRGFFFFFFAFISTSLFTKFCCFRNGNKTFPTKWQMCMIETEPNAWSWFSFFRVFRLFFWLVIISLIARIKSEYSSLIVFILGFQ